MMATAQRGKKVKCVCACGVEFLAREADIKRGWAKSCGKSCAAQKRERELDRNGYRSGSDRRDEEEPTFQNAHQFDNCEL